MEVKFKKRKRRGLLGGSSTQLSNSVEYVEEIKKPKVEEEKPVEKKEIEKKIENESTIVENYKVSKIVGVQHSALLSAKEKALGGTRFTQALDTGWKPRRKVRNRSEMEHDRIRKKYKILISGEDIPPPVRSFKDMRLPKPILKKLDEKNIKRPTPIQMQGLPVALLGRDMIGIAFTGSGKTLTFCLPMILMALGEELKKPLRTKEGPIGLLLGPSRELMNQTHAVVCEFCDALSKEFPKLRTSLFIGGQSKHVQLKEFESRGTHMVIGTPGRVNDFLKSRRIKLNMCRYLGLDEADRMMDGFEEELQETLEYFKLQKQTVLFSATMPKKFVEFAETSLIKPITVNVSRAGATNEKVKQHVELIKAEGGRMMYLLNCLQKTSPPVIIFAQQTKMVDEIFEYLLLKGVSVCSIHGGKDQDERTQAVNQFKNKTRDVLVATDVAAKGLDFPNVKHVINFDLPIIENYVHRIGRTGRAGKKGLATTLIDKSVDPMLLLDLKAILIEAKQKVPKFLQTENEANGQDIECTFCGGMGHSISQCPRRQMSVKRDVVKGDI